MKTDWRGIIIRAKEKGEKFFVVQPEDGLEAKIYCTESNARLPDLIAMGVIEIAKGIHIGSGRKHSPTAALEAVLTHVNTVSRVAIEKYEKTLNGQPSDNSDEANPRLRSVIN